MLNDYIEQSFVKGKENFVLIDEVQMCPNFELTINSLHTMEKFDMYITGSNAFLLSSDLATLFTGRTFEVKVYPFSFKEFLQYYSLDDNYTAFDRYLKEGGMAGSYLYKELEAKYDYIADALTNNKDKNNHKTVGSYLEYLCNAFAFYKFRRYDIQGKKYLASNDKLYLSDHTFRYAK